MRVSAETKAATRSRILDAARQLFTEHGFDATTTRDIARVAEIATGTLFNYFATKEEVMACLASEAVVDALAQFHLKSRDGESFEEALFALVAAGLRKLKPLRKHLPSLLETSLSPLVRAAPDEAASFRLAHLEAVGKLAAGHGYGALSPVALQLYWTLYTGILLFWAGDNSPKQEETLALVDHSLSMFVGWLRDQANVPTTRNK